MSDAKASSASKEAKRKKVNAACLYCRRSHMNCNAERPCERCVRRGIAQLCVEDGKQREEGQPPEGEDQTQLRQTDQQEQQQQQHLRQPTSTPPTSFSQPPPSLGPTSTFPPSVPQPAPPPIPTFVSPPNIHQTRPSPPPNQPSQPSHPQDQSHPETYGHLHPLPQQTFARPSATFFPQQQDVPLAPTPLETTPITSPRVWAGMEDVNMSGEGGMGVEQQPAVDLAGLADMFAPGQEWGSLSGFLDSLDFPISASNQPSPAGAGNNAFSPFNLQQFVASSPRNGPSNPTTPGGGPNPQFLNNFQTAGGGHDQRQLLAALLDAYKHRLPPNIAQPILNQNGNGSSESAMFPPTPQPFDTAPIASSRQLHPPQQHPPQPLQPPPPSNASAPPAPSSTSSGRGLSPYLQQAQLQHHQQLQQTNFSHQPLMPSSAVMQPAPDRSFAEILLAKYESSELATAEEGWDWERGWAKLDDWMGENISQASQARIHAPLAIFRPTVRAILETLSKEDKVLVEESFQRMLLNYDRIFNVVKTPSCLWRRTGEIFKANGEFAALVGVNLDWFRDGRVGIYELMKEDSAVNFWEQYFQVGFDRSRKAVLTTCTLLPPPRLLVPPGKRPSYSKPPRKRAEIPCCFSFTVQRDSWGVPVVVMGQFMGIAI